MASSRALLVDACSRAAGEVRGTGQPVMGIGIDIDQREGAQEEDSGCGALESRTRDVRDIRSALAWEWAELVWAAL
jgi:hypothetical protein